MADQRWVLAAGDSRLTPAPAIGGGVAGLTWRGLDILRHTPDAALASGDPLALGAFPLVPFAGRITGGTFEFAGRRVLLPPNLAGERDAIHGQGWRNAWRVGERSPSRARLIFDHRASDWPWDYRAEQTLDLSDRALVHTLSVLNTSSTPMPAGLGLHP